MPVKGDGGGPSFQSLGRPVRWCGLEGPPALMRWRSLRAMAADGDIATRLLLDRP
jgi:hypothetical protein